MTPPSGTRPMDNEKGVGTLHIRNVRADSCPSTRGAGVTWCGRKLVGDPIRAEDGIVTFSSYGAEVSVTLNPSAGSCAICRQRFDAAYEAAFPEGPKPIATFKLDDPADMAKLRDCFSRGNFEVRP